MCRPTDRRLLRHLTSHPTGRKILTLLFETTGDVQSMSLEERYGVTSRGGGRSKKCNHLPLYRVTYSTGVLHLLRVHFPVRKEG